MDDLLLLIYLSPFLYELYPELSGKKKKKKKYYYKTNVFGKIQTEQKLGYGKSLPFKEIIFLVSLFLNFKSPTKHMLSDSKTLICFLPAPASLMSTPPPNTSQYFVINHITFKKRLSSTLPDS